MAAEVVGTAYVRIKALTTGLSKDMERGLKKGIKDADVKGLGGSVGETFAKGAGEKLQDGLEKSTKKTLKTIGDSGKEEGERLGTLMSKGIKKGVTKAGDPLSPIFERSTRTLRRTIDRTIGPTLARAFGDAGDNSGNRFSRAFTSQLLGVGMTLQSLGGQVGDRFNAGFLGRLRRMPNRISGIFEGSVLTRVARAGRNTSRVWVDRLTNGLVAGTGTIQKAVTRFTEKLDFSGVGKGFSNAVSSLFSGALLKLGFLLLPAIAGLGSLILQYLTAMVAQLGLLVTAIAGAGIALGFMAGSTVLAFGPLLLAFTYASEAMKEFKDLASEVGSEWSEQIGSATQEMMLPGMTDFLTRTKELIPIFRGFGRQVGETAGEFARYMGVVLTSEEGQRRLTAITQGSAPIFGQFARVLAHLGDIFSRLWEVALPVAQQFATAIGDMTGRWAGLINESADNGRLGFTLQIWYDRAKLVFGAFGDLFGAIWNVFNIGGTSAVPFFENFANWAETFREWTKSLEGQNRLKQIFDDALAVTHEFNGLVVDIARAMGSAVFEPDGNEGLVGFIQVLREDVVPWLEDFFATIKGTYGKALSDFFGAFSNFLSKLGEAGAFGVSLAILTGVITALTAVLTTLMEIPGFDTFAAALLGVASAFGVLKTLGIVGLLQGIASGLVTFAGAIGAGFGVAGLGGIAIGFGAIAAAAGVAYLVFRNWDTITATLQNIWAGLQPVRDAFFAIAATVGDALGNIQDKLATAFEGVNFIETVQGWASKFTEFWNEISTGAGGIGDAVGNIIGFFQPLIDILQVTLPYALEFLAGIWENWGDNLAQILRNVWDFLSTVIGEGIDIILGIIKFFLAIITGEWGQAWDSLKEIVTSFWNIVYTVFRTAIKTVGEIIGGIIETIIWPFQFIYDFLVGNSLIPELWDRIKEIFTEGIAAVVNFVKGLPGKLISALSNLISAIGGVFEAAWEAWKAIVTAGIDAVVGFVTAIPERFIAGLSTLASLVGDLFTTAWDLWKSIVTTAIGAIVGFVTAIPGRFIEGLGNLAETVGGFFQTAFDKAKEIVTNAVESIVGLITELPFRLLALAQSLIDTGKELGGMLINALVEGMSGLADKAGDFLTGIKDALKGIFETIINALIDGLNTMIPDSIAKVEVAGYTVFPGVDIKPNPIPRVQLATGGIARRRPGGTDATIGEGRYDEAVIPLPPGTLDGLRNINSLNNAIRDLISYLRLSAGGMNMNGVTVKVESTGSGPRDALSMLDALADASYLRGG